MLSTDKIGRLVTRVKLYSTLNSRPYLSLRLFVYKTHLHISIKYIFNISLPSTFTYSQKTQITVYLKYDFHNFQ